jgi:Uri superfamily endonuclease
MGPEPGTYALILQSQTTGTVQIGRWRQIDIAPGFYLYIGSAFGPGGVRARVQRHFRRTKARHWHIDYLRGHLDPVGAWYSHDPNRLEHRWAQILCGMSDMSPVRGFGCSDCTCDSHLFRTGTIPAIDCFSDRVGSRLAFCPYEQTGH